MSRMAVLIILISSMGLMAAAGTTDYRDRGNRFEGAKRQPIGRQDLHLVGAVVHPESTQASFPPEAALSFFRDGDEGVEVVIRERHPRTSYWLDRALGPGQRGGWLAGTTNRFAWPSSEVLVPLGLRPADLLVLVRLGAKDPTGYRQRVAPAAFVATGHPATVERYRFTFLTAAAAKIRYAVFREGSDQPVLDWSERLEMFAKEPLDIEWHAQGMISGSYHLQIKGHFNRSMTPLASRVEFTHLAAWPKP